MPSSDESIITAEAALASQSKFLPLVPHPCKRARDALTYKLPQLELSHVSKKTFHHRHQEWIGWALSPSFTGLRSVSMFCCSADECCQLMRRSLLSARRSDPDWAPETLLIRGKGSPATPLLHLERGLGRPGRHCGRPAGKGGRANTTIPGSPHNTPKDRSNGGRVVGATASKWEQQGVPYHRTTASKYSTHGVLFAKLQTLRPVRG